jgi:hypothetical protein
MIASNKIPTRDDYCNIISISFGFPFNSPESSSGGTSGRIWQGIRVRTFKRIYLSGPTLMVNRAIGMASLPHNRVD